MSTSSCSVTVRGASGRFNDRAWRVAIRSMEGRSGVLALGGQLRECALAVSSPAAITCVTMEITMCENGCDSSHFLAS